MVRLKIPLTNNKAILHDKICNFGEFIDTIQEVEGLMYYEDFWMEIYIGSWILYIKEEYASFFKLKYGYD